ncbi:hypothetical protein C5B99_12230 [Pseudoclavibacter sp. Z016]|nr:hypothetical protein C5B99_12230 [Pseudoclavibacter sp. Z016]
MNRSRRLATTSAVGVLIVTLVLAIGFCVRQQLPIRDSTRTCVVTAKSSAPWVEGGEQLRVQTANCGEFTVGGLQLRGKRAHYLHASLEVGVSYQFVSRGDSLPALGLAPNIVGATRAD